jgi:hypothetical protein
MKPQAFDRSEHVYRNDARQLKALQRNKLAELTGRMQSRSTKDHAL